jgi:simple sugar transport system ATP-binding protein
MDPTAVLSVEGISKRFGGVQALDEVSLDFVPGKVHCLAGENGSGKSTLIKVISGVEVPDAGTVTLMGRTHRSLTPRAAIRDGVQIIYQDLSMFSNLTVAENIAIAPMIAAGRKIFRGQDAEEIARRAMARIDVDLPLGAHVGDVPIAQRQITAICRALAQDARILFMDEPTTALTRREVDSLFRTVDLLRDQGVAVVFVSHKFNEVLKISDEITVLRNGRVVAAGPASEFDRASLSTAMTGHEVTRLERRERAAVDAPTVLRTEGLSVEGSLNQLSLELHRGEILGITGLMGSGREAVAEALFGITPASSGSIWIDGRTCQIRSVNEAIGHGIGYVPGDRLTEGLFLDHSVAQNVVAASTGEVPRRAGLVLKRSVVALAKRMIDAFGIKTSSAVAPVRTLSGGNQQRVVLAKWFVRKPRVLMLNGPTVGVDVGSKREIMSLLQQLSSDGTAIIVISDDVSELVEVCDRVLVMRHGEVATELLGDELDEDRITQELVA